MTVASFFLGREQLCVDSSTMLKTGMWQSDPRFDIEPFIHLFKDECQLLEAQANVTIKGLVIYTRKDATMPPARSMNVRRTGGHLSELA